MTTHRAFCFRTLYALLAALLIAGQADAQTVDGNVYVHQSGTLYFEDPFSDFLEGVQAQTVNDELLPTDQQFFYERGQDVLVGRDSVGFVQAIGGDDLRYQHLILGGSEEDIDTDNPTVAMLVGSTSGHGTLRVEQAGTSFNNHPLIIPTQYQSFGNPETLRFPLPGNFDVEIDYNFDGNTDRTVTVDATRDTDAGYDAIVGLTGTGELYLNTGARMEIQDAFVVAWGPESSGYVEVDGVGTYLGVYGGLNPNATTPTRGSYSMATNSVHQMIIGAYGEGEMRITGGADVEAFYGAAIGVTRSDGSDEDTDALDTLYDKQGSGRVIVEGAGSVWNIAITAFMGDMLPSGISNTDGGALAIGEFDPTGVYGDEELGQGYLSIRSDGLVRARRYTDGGAGDADAVVRVGRMGTLDFRGGRMVVQDRFMSDGLIQVRDDGVNDVGGAAPGGGRLEVGTFANRRLGEIRVANGQSLSVVSRSEVSTRDTFETVSFNAANFGLIEVLGGDVEGSSEFEFDREFAGDLLALTPFFSGVVRAGDYEELFYNAPATATTPAGQIVGKDATLRFRAGLWNAGEMQFIGGENIVSGRVMNDALAMVPQGSITVTNQSTLTFEDQVVNDGVITVSDDSNVTFLGGGQIATASSYAYEGLGELSLLSTGDSHVNGNFALGDTTNDIGGTLRLYVEEFARDGFSHLVIDGDADFNFGTPGTIEILGNALGVLTVGDAMDLITVTGTADFTGVSIMNNVATAPGIVLVPQSTTSAFSLVVASAVAALQGDFNGDGVVDAADYTVWRDNLGGDDSIFFGNSNGDGVIDALDYAIWTGNYGSVLTLPAPTASLSAAPEPAAIALLGTLALAGLRRRR